MKIYLNLVYFKLHKKKVYYRWSKESKYSQKETHTESSKYYLHAFKSNIGKKESIQSLLGRELSLRWMYLAKYKLLVP